MLYKDFFWGAATSAYQVEGGVEANDWAAAGRTGLLPLAGRAADHRSFFQHDFDIARELGHNAHRFSIEWSLVEPEEGRFDEKELERYLTVAKALKERGIEPFVTIWHFTLPLWFSKTGGFKRKDSAEVFCRYARKVVSVLGGEVKFFITINEPLVFASNGFLKGKWPPLEKSFLNFFKILSRLEEAHKLAFTAIKGMFPEAQVGIAKNNIDFESNANPLNFLKTIFLRWFWNRRFLDKIFDYQDFVGINYYFYRKSGGKEKCETSDMGWAIHPKGLYSVLREVKFYQKPVYVFENGLADKADVKRAEFLRTHIEELKRAMEDGVSVRGYFHWSLIDNFEWDEGFGPRFGLVEVNYKTMERKIRPSALVYKKLIQENS
ncbi:MAG: glycoside hydrolase family 1 protein [bacterium]|nr:glycoside hydrolase family 1 protein [bacterium]